MAEGPTYCALPFKRHGGELKPGDLVECDDVRTAFRRGKALRPGVDGVVYFKIESGEDGDVWSEVELLCADGDVPAEAEPEPWEADAA